uniref:Uncharacterized protein n=1 Tax=Anguilla anguilla TaxID=7936 RepID=A0A0E9RU81_ANGAN
MSVLLHSRCLHKLTDPLPGQVSKPGHDCGPVPFTSWSVFPGKTLVFLKSERQSLAQQALQVCFRMKLWMASSPRLAGPNTKSPGELLSSDVMTEGSVSSKPTPCRSSTRSSPLE